MNDERPHMIRHRLKSLAEGRWADADIAHDLHGVSPEAREIIQRQAAELLAAMDNPSSLMKE